MTFLRSRRHAVHLYAAAFAAAVLPTVVHASETATPVAEQADEVTVKGERVLAPKRTATLVNTPQTIEIIKSDLINQQGATTLTEALRNSPGVGTFYLGENGATATGDAVYMRGSDVSGSIFVDGVRDVASVARDTFNIDQIEVLKGGAGADIGRGAATGAINLITKRPKAEDASSLSLAAGTDYLRAAADVTMKLSDSRAVRINLMTQDSGVPGRDVIDNSRWGVAPTLGLGLGTATRVYLGYVHVEQSNTPDGGVSTIGLPGYSTPDPGVRDFLTTAGRPKSTNFYGTKDDHDDNSTDTLSVLVEHDFAKGWRLRNTTRWNQTDQDYLLGAFLGQGLSGTRPLLTPNAADPSTWTLTRWVNNKDVRNTTLANLTSLQGRFTTGALSHSFSTGLEIVREEQTSWLFAAGGYPAASVYAPDANVSGYVRTRTGARNIGRTDTAGIYVNDTVSLTKAWQLSASVRLDHYETDYTVVDAAGVATRTTIDGDLWSGRLGLVYKPASNGSVYASYAVTRQPPGGANFTLSAGNATNANNPNVEPQTAKTSELGTKWSLGGGTVMVTGALYRTEYSDAVTLDSDGTYSLTGQKSVEGIEVGVSGQITPEWTVTAGYTTMDTKVENQTAVTADGSADLAYAPSDSLSLWSAYKVNDRLTVGGGLRHNGTMKRGSDGAVGTPAFTEGYTVVDGLATYVINPKVELQFNVYNLFDTAYVASINKSGYRYTPGSPRTVRLTANIKF